MAHARRTILDRKEFDRFADEYEALHTASIAVSGEDPSYFARYKALDLHDAAVRTGRLLTRQRILDFGSGVGSLAPHLQDAFEDAYVVGADVSIRSLSLARQRHRGGPCVCFDGRRLPFDDNSFDWAIAACVFHHIHASQHVPLLSEIRRVLKPGGGLMVYEHNPWNPLTRHAVDTCPFDENACLICLPTMLGLFEQAGFARPYGRYRVFFPRPLAWLRALEGRLCRVPLGAQYFVFDVKHGS